MDLAELIQQYCAPIIVLICLTIGFVIKKLDYIPNKFIPLIMFVLGSIFGFITKGWSFDSFVIGAVSGVASTGFYELFKQLIERDDKDDTK
jgi:hypothetical protein